jgi:adenosylcobinamide-phosphate synthase
MSFQLLVLAVALLVDARFGYPDALYQRIGHPVTWIGRMIATLDEAWNRPAASFAARKAAGGAALGMIVAIPGLASHQISWLLVQLLGPFAILAVGVLASTLIAQKSLADHVSRVADGLDRGLDAGREAVSHIVGRDPQSLDEAGVARAAIESLAENYSDGVVAPAFWLGVAGLPGAVVYKAINTADSMIGHRTPRHEAFGWAAARLDDLVNLPASRLAALFLTLAAMTLPGADARAAWRAVRRDAGKHRSPNAGWPEAAMAGALGLKLAGPRVYGGTRVDDAHMGDGRAEATASDIRRALALYRRALVVQGVLVGLGVVVAVAIAG